jgi:methylated-DNA-[protein]-cysteine S-methyltransferase
VIVNDQGMSLQIASLKTPIGTLNLIADGELLLGANFSSIKALKESVDQRYLGSEFKSVKKIPGISPLINDYFAGDLTALNAIKVSQPGGVFSQAAWKSMRKVHAGKVISYSQLAEKAGSPKAVRAAGSACAKNAIVLVVPCHRIIKTGGDLGNYAYGVNKKLWLLRHEGVQ